MKLREKILIPAADRADPMVSPGCAGTVRPSNRKETRRPRSITSPGCGSSLFMGTSKAGAAGFRALFFGHLFCFELLGPECGPNLVGGSVPFAEEPKPATHAMVPPLGLEAGRVGPHIQIPGPLFLRGAQGGPGQMFASEVKLISRAGTTVGTSYQKGQSLLSLADRFRALPAGTAAESFASSHQRDAGDHGGL